MQPAPAFETGLAFLPMAIASFVIFINVHRFTRRVPSSVLLGVGMFLIGVGVLWLSRVGTDSPFLAAVAEDFRAGRVG